MIHKPGTLSAAHYAQFTKKNRTVFDSRMISKTVRYDLNNHK